MKLQESVHGGKFGIDRLNRGNVGDFLMRQGGNRTNGSAGFRETENHRGNDDKSCQPGGLVKPSLTVQFVCHKALVPSHFHSTTAKAKGDFRLHGSSFSFGLSAASEAS